MPRTDESKGESRLRSLPGTQANPNGCALPQVERERLGEADKLLALVQHTVSAPGQDLAGDVRAGCYLVLDQIRDAIKNLASPPGEKQH